MGVMIVFGGLAVALFLAAFITKRRFGLLGLSLAAGSVLSGIWSFDAGLLVSTIGLFPSGPLTTAMTMSAILLIPAAILLFHGSSYKGLVGRIIGAGLFALLALAFLVEPLGRALVVEGVGVNVYGWIVNNHPTIIGIGLLLAVIDLFFTRSSQSVDKSSKH